MMKGRCYSTLAERDDDGFCSRALRRLTGGRRQFPVRVTFTRREVLEVRAEDAPRLSISGVQDKVSVVLKQGDLIQVTEGGAYILKPIPSLALPRHTDLVPANEHLTMQIAEQVFGMDVAANAFLRMADGEAAYVTRRFDRVDGGLKLPMEDFCSLAKRSPETHGMNFKYDGSYEEVGLLIKRYCPAFRIQLERFFQCVCFNYLIGNGDAHLKNFSVLASPDGDPVLSPSYDLLCSALHLPNEHRLALDLFTDDFESAAYAENGFHDGGDFRELASRLGIPCTRADRVLQQITSPDRMLAIESLVKRSFLSQEAQGHYIEIVADRQKALSLA